MATVKLYRTKSERLPQLPVRNGNIVFVSDTRQICLDADGLRIPYDPIKIFDTEQERADCDEPVTGFYFVIETNVLWRYSDNLWNQLTPSNLTPIVYGKVISDFPEVGESDILYIADESIYKWDDTINQYVIVSNRTSWQKLE